MVTVMLLTNSTARELIMDGSSSYLFYPVFFIPLASSTFPLIKTDLEKSSNIHAEDEIRMKIYDSISVTSQDVKHTFSKRAGDAGKRRMLHLRH
jgi:hypothetical protein